MLVGTTPALTLVGVGATFSLAAAENGSMLCMCSGVLGVKGSSPFSDDEEDWPPDGDDDMLDHRWLSEPMAMGPP